MHAVPSVQDNRRFVRLPYAAKAGYQYGARERGRAAVLDVDRGGVCMRMGRYLRPGTSILLQLPDDDNRLNDYELKGCIVWCEPVNGTSEFAAGIRIMHDEPEAIVKMSRLIHHALLLSGRLVSAAGTFARDEIAQNDATPWQDKPLHPCGSVVSFRQLGSTSPAS